MNMAMEVMEVTASMYRTPTFRFASAVSLANGTTASVSITGATIPMGTSMNTIRSAVPGVRSSLNSSLTRSAMGCNSPKGPQRLGPTRFWNLPISFRSAHENPAAPSSTALVRIRMMTNPATRYDSQHGNTCPTKL